MIFEWDEDKRLSNLAKHEIDFRRAEDIFADPKARVYPSSRPSDERRFLITGLIDGAFVTAVFTRRDPAIRIISMRAARPNERDHYGQD